MPDQLDQERRTVHAFKNHLSIIIGFCDLLMVQVPVEDPKHADLMEIHKAGHAALALVPDLPTEVQ